jgi:lysophospholipase L1-like esterase
MVDIGGARVRFAALGDSTTAGIGDPVPGGGWRGWAALLAGVLAPAGDVALSNFAICGATVQHVRLVQLGPALAVEPTVASVLVGVNDTLRRDFDPDRMAADLDDVVGALAAAGATVLTARMPLPVLAADLPVMLRRPLADRIGALNVVLDAVAARHGTLHLDLHGHPSACERLTWSIDRLHPSERGHRLVACGFADLLADAGWPLVGRPGVDPDGDGAGSWVHTWWLARQAAAWVAERCADLGPSLAGAAVRQAWVRRPGIPLPPRLSFVPGARSAAARVPSQRQPSSLTTLQVHDPT